MEADLTASTNDGQFATWQLFVPSTGRLVSESTAHKRAGDWAESARNDMESHASAKLFREALRNFEPSKVSSIKELFRGISWDGPLPPSRERMGPPPNDNCKTAGRYNTAGNAVLYLSDSENGVIREREAWGATDRAYIQKYKLPLNDLRIADFTTGSIEHLLAHVFLFAERCKYKDGPNSYDFSQVVAKLVAERFDGMIVPGVRGEEGSTYANVVLFKPHEPEGRWKEWMDESDPYSLNTAMSEFAVVSKA